MRGEFDCVYRAVVERFLLILSYPPLSHRRLSRALLTSLDEK